MKNRGRIDNGIARGAWFKIEAENREAEERVVANPRERHVVVLLDIERVDSRGGRGFDLDVFHKWFIREGHFA